MLKTYFYNLLYTNSHTFDTYTRDTNINCLENDIRIFIVVYTQIEALHLQPNNEDAFAYEKVCYIGEVISLFILVNF